MIIATIVHNTIHDITEFLFQFFSLSIFEIILNFLLTKEDLFPVLEPFFDFGFLIFLIIFSNLESEKLFKVAVILPRDILISPTSSKVGIYLFFM